MAATEVDQMVHFARGRLDTVVGEQGTTTTIVLGGHGTLLHHACGTARFPAD